MKKYKGKRMLHLLLAVIFMVSSILSGGAHVSAQDVSGNNATIEIKGNHILIDPAEHGSVTIISEKDIEEEGAYVTIKAVPEAGYILKKIQVNHGEVKIMPMRENGIYRFIMPDEEVSVQTEFVWAEIKRPGSEVPTFDENGTYFGEETLEEVLELAEEGIDLQEFFQFSIWDVLDIDDIRYLVENDISLEELFDMISGQTPYNNKEELREILKKVSKSYDTCVSDLSNYQNVMESDIVPIIIEGNTAVAGVTGHVSDERLGVIEAFGQREQGYMSRHTLSGESAFCALYGAPLRVGMVYTKTDGDSLGIDREQQYYIYRIIGWYYDAQQINDNTGNYAITQAAIWLVRNGRWGEAEDMAAAIRPMLTKVSVLNDALSLSLFQAMADWVNSPEKNTPKVGIDFWENGPNQYLVTVGGELTVDTKDPEYSAHVKIEKTDSITGESIQGEAQFAIFTEDGTNTGATFTKEGNTYVSSKIIKDATHYRFYVQEISAPPGYQLDEGKRYFTIEDGDINAEKVITTNGSSFANQPYCVQIKIPKTDSETGKQIAAQASFTVYCENGTLSQPVTFTKSGEGYLSSMIYYNESNLGRFYVEETKAPNGYFGDWKSGNSGDKKKYSFVVDSKSNGKVLVIENGNATFSNDRVKGTITLKKMDVEAGSYLTGDSAHGDTSLDGAVYGLYARENIMWPDGSGVKYPVNTLVAQGIVRNGSITWNELYLGAYYIKEIAAPIGYLPDAKSYNVTLTYAGESVDLVTGSTTVDEQVMKQAFQLVKLEGEDSEHPAVLAGAGFSVYLLSDLGIESAGKTNEELIEELTGQYPDYKQGLDKNALAKVYENDNSVITAYNAAQAAVGGKGLTQISPNRYQLNEMFTNTEGALYSPELPYGVYIVVETTVPGNSLLDIKPFIVRIDKDSREYQVQRYIMDRDFKAKIKVVKIDAETGKEVLKSGIAYKIFSYDMNDYVKIPVVIDNKEEIKEIFVSNEDGYILTDAALPCGRYRLDEIQAPDGFYNESAATGSTKGTVDFEINTDQTYDMSEVSGDVVITLTYTNHEARGELTLEKIGEKLTGVSTSEPVEASLFSSILNLFSSSTKTEDEDHDVEFIYEKRPLAGAEYTIEAAEDIVTQDNQNGADGTRTVWFHKGDIVAVITTGDEGQIDAVNIPSGSYSSHPIVKVIHRGEEGQVAIQLPLGSYKIYETKAPYGYIHSEEVKYVTYTWDGQTEDIVINSTQDTDEDGVAVFENERVKPKPRDDSSDLGVGIYKKDKDTEEAIAGTVFGLYTKDAIYDGDGSLLAEADTLLALTETDESGYAVFDVDIPYMSEGYTQGSHGLNSGDYYIVEHEVPDGFFLDQTPLMVHFEYQDEHTPFVVVKTEQENISTSVDFYKAEMGGRVLPGAKLQILEEESGEMIHEWISSEKAETVRRLKLSTDEEENIYILREIQPAAGYVTAKDIRFKLFQAKDSDGNLLQKADVYILTDLNETPIMSGEMKAGLDNKDRKVTYITWKLIEKVLIVEVNTQIEEEILSVVVREEDFEELEFNAVYFSKGSLEGFFEDLVVKKLPEEANKKKNLAWVKDADSIVIMQDDITKVYISKYDIADAGPVVGAHMELRDEEGNVVASWVTTEEDYYIEKLSPGKYTLIETQVPTKNGYVKAESVTFIVEDDGTIQKVKMGDDHTKLDISKADIGGNEVPGAHLVLKNKNGKVIDEWDSTEEPHRIEYIEPGEYTLEETMVPSGYVQAEKVTFVVEETGKVQKVIMEDDFTRIDILKIDSTTKEPVVGASLAILDKDGKEAYAWISDGDPYHIEKIPQGKYTLVEKEAPEGYLLADPVEFEITTEDIDHRIEMKDEPAKGNIIVHKKGDILTGTTSYESGYGTIYQFTFESDFLARVEFTVYDSEGEVVDVFVTDEKGDGISKDLNVGDYIVKETKPPAGLAANYNEYKVKIEYQKGKGIIDTELNIQNKVLSTEINVYKVGEVMVLNDGTLGYGHKPLEGIYFGIYTNEDIKAADGHVVLPKDRLIGVIKTNKNGKAVLKAALVSGSYYYKELRTLAGYELDTDIHPFELTLENEPTTIFEVNKANPLVNKAKKNSVQLIKVDASNSTARLAGVEFTLYTSAGVKIGTYTTDENGEIFLGGLAYGDYYFKETRSLDGYQRIMGKIKFSIGKERVVITCKNSRIPKLGFEDSYLWIALGFIAVALSGFITIWFIWMRKRERRGGSNE